MDKSSHWNTDMKWGDMTARQKLAFCGKFIIALCTFGFAFPHILE